MQRRKFILNSTLTLAGLTLSNKEMFAFFLSDPGWKIKMLTDNIGVFSEKGGTIAFLLSTNGTVVVDAQFPDSAGHLIGEIKKKTENPFDLLINTHHHGDHTSGNIAFKGLVKHILAHENSKTNQARVAKEQNKEDQQLYPDQIFTTTWCAPSAKEKICLSYFGPGHTNGDSLVHFQHANIVHLGDLVFNRRHPYIDKSAGADIGNWIKLLDKATNTYDRKTQYICGHAGDGYDIVIKTEDLLAFRDYLGNLLTFVEKEIKAGKTKEDILKATAIPGSPEWKGEGIDRPLKAAYQELTT